MTKHFSQRERSTRTLCLVDVENCASTSHVSLEHASRVRDAIKQAAPEVLIHIVACSHHNAAATRFAFSRSRVVVRSGNNGADLALIDVIETENVEKRFGRVIIASGDHIFAHAAKRLRRAGVTVEALAINGQISRDFACTCNAVRYLSVQNLGSSNV